MLLRSVSDIELTIFMNQQDWEEGASFNKLFDHLKRVIIFDMPSSETVVVHGGDIRAVVSWKNTKISRVLAQVYDLQIVTPEREGEHFYWSF